MSLNTALRNERPLVDKFESPDRLVMGAGPSRVHEGVLKVMSQTTIGHLDPNIIVMMDQLKDMLRYIFQTYNDMIFPVSVPGSLGMEAVVNNMVDPGDERCCSPRPLPITQNLHHERNGVWPHTR